MLIGGALAFALALLVSTQSDAAVGIQLTKNTIRLSMVWYFAALMLMTRLAPADWQASTRLGRIARWCWTWGCIVYLVHVGFAFHFYHDWSHARAFAHTREIGGIGEGIFANYLFTGIWSLDVVWWWLSAATYADRPAWIDRAIHCYMLFITFNATVVFLNHWIRWPAILLFVALAATWYSCRAARRLRDSG